MWACGQTIVAHDIQKQKLLELWSCRQLANPNCGDGTFVFITQSPFLEAIIAPSVVGQRNVKQTKGIVSSEPANLKSSYSVELSENCACSHEHYSTNILLSRYHVAGRLEPIVVCMSEFGAPPTHDYQESLSTLVMLYCILSYNSAPHALIVGSYQQWLRNFFGHRDWL